MADTRTKKDRLLPYIEAKSEILEACKEILKQAQESGTSGLDFEYSTSK